MQHVDNVAIWSVQVAMRPPRHIVESSAASLRHVRLVVMATVLTSGKERTLASAVAVTSATSDASRPQETALMKRDEAQPGLAETLAASGTSSV